MKIFPVQFITVLLVASLPLNAWALSDVGSRSEKDQRIYEETLRLCSDVSTSAILDVAISGIEESAIDTFKLRLNGKLREMMDSDGFYDAVDRCYGRNETNKALFFSSLIAADIAGKATGAALLLAIWKLYGKLIKGLRLAGGHLAASTGIPQLKHLGVIAQAGVWVPLIYASVKAYAANQAARDRLLEQDPALRDTVEALEAGTISEQEAGRYYAESTVGQFDSMVEQLQAMFLEDLAAEISRLDEELRTERDSRRQRELHARILRLEEILHGTRSGEEMCRADFIETTQVCLP